MLRLCHSEPFDFAQDRLRRGISQCYPMSGDLRRTIRDLSTSVEMTELPNTSDESSIFRVAMNRIPVFHHDMKRFLIFHVFGALVAAMAHGATNFDVAAKATNELAVALHRQLATGNENLCVSPFSIESALAMTFAGADGDTRTEMARVLHFPSDAIAVAASFASLQHSLAEMSVRTAELVKKSREFGGPSEPITLSIANKLFAQKGY